jgi:hypothetical protein
MSEVGFPTMALSSAAAMAECFASGVPVRKPSHFRGFGDLRDDKFVEQRT